MAEIAYLKRIILDADIMPTTYESFLSGEDHWFCEDCIDHWAIDGDVIDQGVELRECAICGAES